MLRAAFKRIKPIEARFGRRNAFFGATSDYQAIPLDQAVLDVGNPGPFEKSPAQLTTLSNGLRVVSQDTQGAMATVGLFIDAGSRREQPHVGGLSHVLEKSAFKATDARSSFKLAQDLQALGATAQAQASRDNMLYSIDLMSDDAAVGLEMLAEITQIPRFNDWELEEEKELLKKAEKEREDDLETFLGDAAHEVAYGGAGLGQQHLPSSATLPHINKRSLTAFMKENYTPKNMVVTGAGVDHEQFVRDVEERFGFLTEGPTERPPIKANYVGGEARFTNTTKGETHFLAGFETPHWSHDDLVPACVLNMMMGGGGSFSTGGPGKGMFSRLYTNVLARHHWVHNVISFQALYSDSSLMGVYGVSGNENAAALGKVIMEETRRMAGPVDTQELARAKNLLKGTTLTGLEARVGLFEDLGRQTLVYGERIEPSEIAKRIDAVTAKDIQRVATDMFKTKPTVVGYGNISDLPAYSDVEAFFRK